MDYNKKDLISIADPKTAVQKYRKNPGSFQYACNYAAHVARRTGEPVAIIPGNSYGRSVMHVVGLDYDLEVLAPGVGNRYVEGAIIDKDCNVFFAEFRR